MRRSAYLWAAVLVAGLLALAPLTPAAAHSLSSASSTNQRYLRCQYRDETDDIQINSVPSNPFNDDLGNQWIVYYDITRDRSDNSPCDMRVVVRIFPPSPDGSWKGTLQVYARKNGVDVSVSHGKLSSSTTYPGHLVWRGPWFAAAGGGTSYVIKVEEYNGSTVCAECSRATATFNL